MKRGTALALLGILLAAGLAMLFYPSVSSWYNEQYQIRAVVEYDHAVENMAADAIDGELAKARAYNDALAARPLADPFAAGGHIVLPENYASILNGGNGIMGSIQIPKINANLPIYHGTGPEVLEKGVGHMEMTALPIGGEGNHTVLTGHTGLPGAKLFTELALLEEGDVFTLRIHKQTLAYRVDQIVVVLPSDTAALATEDGKDYVSLVTCTPYGINSHRLLVRGVRIAFPEQEPEPASKLAAVAAADGKAFRFDLLIALSALALVILAALILGVRKILRSGRSRL